MQTDGYRFDFQGEQARRADEGEIDRELTSIVVDHRFGDVLVLATEDDPTWTWEVTCWADTKEEAEKYAKEVKLKSEVVEGRHSWTLVLPEPPVNGLRGVESKLTLRVPATARVELKNEHGATTIDGMTAGTKANCRHGRLELRNLQGALEAATEHAELIAEHVAGGSLTNRHGKVTVNDVMGDLQVKTAHAAMSLVKVSGNVQASNEHGEVRVSGIGGSLHVKNKHGKIVAESVDAGVDLQTSHARIELAEVGGDARLRNRHGAISTSGVAGKLDVETSHGAIDLNGSSKNIVSKNEHGRIRIVLTDSGFRSVRAETSFADIEIEFPAEARPTVEAGTEHGKIDSDVPVLRLNPRVDNFVGMEAGASRMSLKNRHGNIRIRRAGGADGK
jgi:hypothetical protein